MKKFTFIDTPSHGYLKVTKKYITKIGYDLKNISSCSGVNSTHVFLEEDCDATKFLDFLESKGIKNTYTYKYNETFNVTHNFSEVLFNLVPKIGCEFTLWNDQEFRIFDKLTRSTWLIKNNNGKIYKVSTKKLFSYGMVKLAK